MTKKTLINKLRSQTGASISFALLLFLVCTMLCSVMLTAATATAGRMSGIAKTDQRYYAITSAAKLLKNLIDGKTVSVVEVTETTYTTTYNDGVAGDPAEGESVTKIYIVPDKTSSQITAADYVDSNLIDHAYFKIDSIPEDAAKRIHNNETLNERELTITSSFYSDEGLDYDALSATVLEDLDANGNIKLTVYNQYKAENEESDPGSRYSLVASFGSEISKTNSKNTETVSSTAIDDHTYNVETKTTKTTITTITWNLIDIQACA